MTSPLCPVCRSRATAHTISFKGMELFSCAGCAALFMHPMPTPEELDRFYGNPYDGATVGYYAKAEKKLRRGRKRARLLHGFVTTPGRRFLDIGCSAGYTTQAMHELGYAATGVDVDRPGIAQAEKAYPHNTYRQGFWPQVGEGLGAFDAIHCSEVIEHVPDPHPFVQGLARALVPGGVVNLTTPDVAHWNRPRDLLKWKDFGPPAHCLYFSPKALRRLLGFYGLEVVWHRPNWKAGIQVYARKVMAEAATG